MDYVKSYLDKLFISFSETNVKLRTFSDKCLKLVALASRYTSESTCTVILLTLRLLMSYIYIYTEHLFLMFLDHTQRSSTVGRTPLDE